MIKNSDGIKITQMLSQENTLVQISLDLAQKRQDTIQMDFWFSPDSYTGLNFMANLASRDHGLDLDTTLTLNPHFVIWHCDDCASQKYLTTKDGCFSGGRYCAMSGTGGDTKKAELV
jgi:hypothetical protein